MSAEGRGEGGDSDQMRRERGRRKKIDQEIPPVGEPMGVVVVVVTVVVAFFWGPLFFC